MVFTYHKFFKPWHPILLTLTNPPPSPNIRHPPPPSAKFGTVVKWHEEHWIRPLDTARFFKLFSLFLILLVESPPPKKKSIILPNRVIIQLMNVNLIFLRIEFTLGPL